MDTDVIEIMLCVNDENGNDTGFCEAAEFRWRDESDPEPMLKLDLYPIPYKYDYEHGWIMVEAETYPIQAYGTRVGNNLWDMVQVSPEQAASLIRHLLAWGATVEQGFDAIFRKADRGSVTVQDLLDYMPF